jgi:hypothetical protein
LLALLAFSGTSGKILNLLPDSPVIDYLFYALLAMGCYALVQLVMKPRTIVEFDDDNLDIVRVKAQQERAIPLRNLIKLSLRPPKLEFGAYWFWTYSLTFTGDGVTEEEIRFMTLVGRTAYPHGQESRLRGQEFDVLLVVRGGVRWNI